MVVLANAPQVLIAFVYIFYNNILMAMFYSHSIMKHSTTPRFLRLSNPDPKPSLWFTIGRIVVPFAVHEPPNRPRANYELGLPWFVALPFIILLGVLHWLVSQSIFFVNIENYSTDGTLLPWQILVICGYSPSAVIFGAILGLLLFVTLIGLGCLPFPAGMPLLSTCSLTLSAACHVLPHIEGETNREKCIVRQALKYGTYPGWGGDGERVGFYPCNAKGRECERLSEEEVKPLIKGKTYGSGF